MEDIVEKCETIPEPEQPEEPIVESPPEPEPKKRGRGRPAGAKDAVPRKKKITIQEEAPPPHPEPEPKEEAPPPPEPVSPGRALREAGELIHRSQHFKKEARKTNLRELYTKHLLSLP